MHPGVQSWKNLLKYAYNAFSIPLLLRTLFSPWQMDKGEGSKFVFAERVAFAIFTRLLGFIARAILIILGLIFCVAVLITFPFFFFVPVKISLLDLQDLGSFGAQLSYGSTYYLNKHGHDLSSSASFKMYGKDKALRMIERGLDKDKNRSVLLVGETGVGKKSMLNFLGRLGQSGFTFPGILHHRVVELEVEGIAIDAFDKAMNEAAQAGNVIIVIRNIHAYPALFERLKPYLDMKHLGIIITTDFANYDQVLKAHPDFLSKFEKVDLEPASYEDTLSILWNHILLNRIKIDEEAVVEIVRLADRFIANQAQPLKSILILEELRVIGHKITVEDVRQVVSDKTNMPIGSLSQDERAVLLELEARMRKEIVGQEEAVKDVTEALKRLRTGVADPSKAAGSFLFLGPTGVGKTYTAKILAECFFGRRDAMIRFDMSEFALPDSIPVFTDRLSSVIEEHPLSLVFFDELEKANRAVHNLLLQVLDEGRLTRESGRVASFKDAIIIATSNAGSADIISNPNIDKKVLIDILIKKSLFAPEFLNRFSGIVVFKPLDNIQVKKVAEIMLRDFSARIFADKKINLEITPALVEHVASAGFDPEFGARPIRRAMEDIVENKVADYIINGGKEGNLKIL